MCNYSFIVSSITNWMRSKLHLVRCDCTRYLCDYWGLRSIFVGKIRSHCKCTKIYPWVGVYGFRKNIKNIALDLDVFTLKIMESHLNHTWFRCYMGVHDHGQVWDDTEIICMCMCIGCIYVAWVVISWKNVAANIECPIDIQLGWVCVGVYFR